MLGFLFPIPIFMVGTALLGRRLSGLARWERKLLWIALAAHLVAVYAIIIITKYYYGGGDMLNYHEYGTFVARDMTFSVNGFTPVVDLFLQRGGEHLVPYGAGSSTGSMHATGAFLSYFFGRSLFASCAVISLAAFFAKFAIYRVIRQELPSGYWRPVLLATMLTPSAVYWSSGLLKEAVAIVFLSFMIVGGHNLSKRHRLVPSAAVLVCGVVGCAIFKSYLLVPFGLAATAWLYVRHANRTRRSSVAKPMRFVIGVVVALALLITIGNLFPRYDFRNFQDQIANEQHYGSLVEGGSDIRQQGAPGSGLSLLTSVPMAIVTALLRPTLIEARNPLALANSLETLIIALLLWQMLRRRGLRESFHTIRQSSFLSFCAVFCLVLAIGVGFSSTNLGTLSRYRMPLVPFLMALLAVLSTRVRPTSA